MFIVKTIAPPSGILFRRQLFDHAWNEGLSIGEDRLYVLQGLFEREIAAACTFETLWRYRVHQGNLYTGNPDRLRLSRGEIRSKECFLEEYGGRVTSAQHKILRRSLALSYFDLGYHLLDAGDYDAAIESFRASSRLHRSLRTSALKLKAWVQRIRSRTAR